ncbi:MAG: DgaE family pyridoxal phosphate-dependent ammonia lyase [Chloroflexi bacterium OHK40]
MSLLDTLGVRRVINADARLTRLGGSLMPPEVRAAMEDAARAYVDMFELQEAVGRRLAELTRNEAAFVCTGAAAGLFLAALACMAGASPERIARLPLLDGCRDEIVIHRAHRVPYDQAVRLAGARLVEIGNHGPPTPEELAAAIGSRTAAVLYVAGAHLAGGALPLPEVVAVARAHGLPVIVDAAAQLPPPENLWRFTRDLGADLAIFSGGKDLAGPQASGLIVGQAGLVAACAAHAAPHQRLGRPMKVGKEELAGLLAAVERYLRLDHAARIARFEQIVADWVAALDDGAGVRARRVFPNEAGQPTPRLLLTLDPARCSVSGDELRRRLWEDSPRIAVASAGEHGISLTPDTLEPGEELLVVAAIQRVLRR